MLVAANGLLFRVEEVVEEGDREIVFKFGVLFGEAALLFFGNTADLGGDAFAIRGNFLWD